MSIKVFIEYKVKSAERDSFISLLPELKQCLQGLGAEQVRVFEGTDQPLLFVEEYYVDHIDHYQRIKDERLQENEPFWEKIHTCIEGGATKVHIWAFEEI